MNSRPCLKARVSAVRADGATIFFAKPPTSRPRWSLQIPATAPCCDSLHHDPSTFNFHEPDGGGDHPSIGKPLSSLSLCFPSFWFQCSYRLRSLIASVITPRGRGLLFRKTFAFRSFQMSQSTLARIPPDFDPTWEEGGDVRAFQERSYTSDTMDRVRVFSCKGFPSLGEHYCIHSIGRSEFSGSAESAICESIGS
ncbi:uncharacterized protein LOC130139561 isoform X1 [Syzygium oleosum]|uniref:uncharacterized protein LOC130139561 isoform X1 n=1 Tax=Syzygium oleosum TaxID=219896 RepID=UPI0024BA9547|nr:uncharacterized protein LOC130139561 isoform X1 [Syzygium oleosum]